MKRGEIYFQHYKDIEGREKNAPVLVISNNAYNARSEFATVIRMTRYGQDNYASVPIPQAAFTETTCAMRDCFAVPGTVSSVRKTGLSGPVAVLTEPYLSTVEKNVKELVSGIKGENEAETNAADHSGNTTGNSWYSAFNSPQMRETKPAEE